MDYIHTIIVSHDLDDEMINFVDADVSTHRIIKENNITVIDAFPNIVLDSILPEENAIHVTQAKVDLISSIRVNSAQAKMVLNDGKTLKSVGFSCFAYPLMFDFISHPFDIVARSWAKSTIIVGYTLGYYARKMAAILEEYDITSFDLLVTYINELNQVQLADECDIIFACLYGIWLCDSGRISINAQHTHVCLRVDPINDIVPIKLITKICNDQGRISTTVSKWIHENIRTFIGASHGMFCDGETHAHTISKSDQYRKAVFAAILFLKDRETCKVNYKKVHLYASVLLQVMTVGWYDRDQDSSLISVISSAHGSDFDKMMITYSQLGCYVLSCSEASRLLTHPITLDVEQIDATKILFSVRLRTRYLQLYGNDVNALPKTYLNVAATGTGKTVIVLFYTYVTKQKVILVCEDLIGFSWEEQDSKLGTNTLFHRTDSASKNHTMNGEIVNIPNTTYECLRTTNTFLNIERIDIHSNNDRIEPTDLLLESIESDCVFVFDEIDRAVGMNDTSDNDEGTQTYASVNAISRIVNSSRSLSMVIGLTATPGDDIDLHMWKHVNIMGFGPVGSSEMYDNVKSMLITLTSLYVSTKLHELDHTFKTECNPSEIALSYTDPVSVYTMLIMKYNIASVFGVKRPKAQRLIINPTKYYSDMVAKERQLFDAGISKNYSVLMQLTESAKADVLAKYVVNLLRTTDRKVVIFANYLHTFNVICHRILSELGSDSVQVEMDKSSNAHSTPGVIKINTHDIKTSVVCINGNTPSKTRTRRISSFQAYHMTTRVLIASAKCGSSGVDYGDNYGDMCRSVFILPGYSFRVCAQELGRCWRRSSKSDPDSYILFMREDISEVTMYGRLQNRANMSNIFLKQGHPHVDDSSIIEESEHELVMTSDAVLVYV
jgi:hypothetical protein